MPVVIRVIELFLLLMTLWLLPVQASAHGGGLDGLSCHHNRKAGGYHCHRGDLVGQSFGSKGQAPNCDQLIADRVELGWFKFIVASSSIDSVS